jgi:hypothetical protein
MGDLSIPGGSLSSPAPENQSELDRVLSSLYSARDCFNADPFFSALAQARESVESDKASYRDLAAQRLYLRLLQQWMQTISFIGTEGFEEYRLAMQERAAALPKDDSNSVAARDARSLDDLLMAMEGGFALIADQMSQTGSSSLGVDAWAVRQPDYRILPQGVRPDPNHEQQYGLPPQLLEAATAYLRLAKEYLNERLLEGYGQMIEGSLPESVATALQRVGYSFRMAASVEAAAAALMDVARPAERGCTKETEAVDCPGSSCSTRDGSHGICVGEKWVERWNAARRAYHRVRRELVEKAMAAQNPLGISENDLPLFFGDLTGTNSRFFAASDYLINTWAVSAVSSAQGALDKARDAWIARRNAGFQDTMNQQEEDRRLQAVKQKYGQQILENCGLSQSTTAEKALEYAAKTYGVEGLPGYEIFADNMKECFIDRQKKNKNGNLVCNAAEVPVAENPTQEQIDDCVTEKIEFERADYLVSTGYYKEHSSGCLAHCKGFFRDVRNEDKTGDQTVWLRDREAPPPNWKQWGYAQWQAERKKNGEPYKHYEGDKTLYACTYPTRGEYSKYSDFPAEMQIVHCKEDDAGQIKWCLPEWSDAPPGEGANRAGSVEGVCHCSDGTLDKPCKGHKTTECGPDDMHYPYGQPGVPENSCYSEGDGYVVAEQSDGTWVYRECQQEDCLNPDPNTPRNDLCGLPYYYTDQFGGRQIADVYFETGGSASNRCFGDHYYEVNCNREACDAAAGKWSRLQTVSDPRRRAYEEECEQQVGSSLMKVTVTKNPPDCYRGRLGAALLRVYSALGDVELAQMTWTAAQNSYAIQGRLCAQMEDSLLKLVQRQKEFDVQMSGWRAAKAEADKMVVAVRAAGAFLSGVAGVLTTGEKGLGGLVNGVMSADAAPLEIESIELERKMGDAQSGFDSFVRKMSAETQVQMCYSEANKIKAQFDVQKGQIVRRANDLTIAKEEFVQLLRQTQSAYAEGRADVTRESGRTAPAFAHSYWYDEKAERYLGQFAWAQRLVYLAMRAVEYEFQQSLGLRKEILTAKHPDQLEVAIRTLQAEVATRAINRRRPEAGSTVLSLRDDILGIIDLSANPISGERNFAPLQTFRSRLWDPKYAVYDRAGKWAGQGIPFVLNPEGALVDRCAERLWQITATIQGDGLSEKEPGAPIKLLKRNTFTSQWCEGRSDGSSAQIGHLEPSRNLFKEDPGAGIPGEYEAYSTAAVYPWFNVRRADFYKSQYQEGASQELAGRGLYGDYVLLFPAELLEGKAVPNPPEGLLGASYRINKFPLDRVEDVLLRFDYISVDNFSARGVQVKQ